MFEPEFDENTSKAIILGWPIFIVEVLLSFPARTRYFVVPLVLGMLPAWVERRKQPNTA